MFTGFSVIMPTYNQVSYIRNAICSLKNAFEAEKEAVLIYTLAKSEMMDSLIMEMKSTTNGLFNNHSLQLVQAAHRKTSDRWMTRAEWDSEDLVH